MFNNTSKMLLLSGLLINTVIQWWLGYEWINMIGYSLIFAGLVLSKNTMIESHSDYGIYIYYTLLVIFLILVFVKWFLK